MPVKGSLHDTVIDDKEGKPVGILHHIGQRPVFAAGNSTDEQARRVLDRIDEQDKSWKFALGDLEERKHWTTAWTPSMI